MESCVRVESRSDESGLSAFPARQNTRRPSEKAPRWELNIGGDGRTLPTPYSPLPMTSFQLSTIECFRGSAMSVTPKRKMTEERLLGIRAEGRESHGLDLSDVTPVRNPPMSR